MARPITRTDAHSLLTILARAVAVCLFVYALVQGVQMAALAVGRNWEIESIPMFASIGILLVLSVMLWLFADVLLKLSLSRPNAPVFESAMAPVEWQGIVFAGIGLWLLVNAVINLAYWLMQLAFAYRRPGADHIDVWFSNDYLFAEPAGIAVSLVIGLLLLLRARGLAGLLARIRGYDQPFVVESDASSKPAVSSHSERD